MFFIKNAVVMGLAFAFTITSSFAVGPEFEEFRAQFEQSSLDINLPAESTYKCVGISDDGEPLIDQHLIQISKNDKEVRLASIQDPSQLIVFNSSSSGYAFTIVLNEKENASLLILLRQNNLGEIYAFGNPSVRLIETENSRSTYYQSYMKCVVNQ